jgi:hypothetical protein
MYVRLGQVVTDENADVQYIQSGLPEIYTGTTNVPESTGAGGATVVPSYAPSSATTPPPSSPVVVPTVAAPATLTPLQILTQAATPSPATVVSSVAPAASTNLSTWLSQSTIISGLSNQAVTLGGLLFGGALAIIVSTKKKK